MTPWQRMRRRGAAAAALIATIASPLAVAAAFDLEGHRGARGLAPENTLAAFRLALAIGVSTLETDLAITRDGVVVISHDPRLNPDLVRGADGRWIASPGPSIHSLTLAELERYDVGRIDPASRYARQFPHQRAVDGERFPTLTSLLALVRESGKPVRLNLETKITPDDVAAPDPETFVRRVIETIRAADMIDRVTIQSFDWRTLVESRRVEPAIPTSCLTARTASMDTVSAPAGAASPWHAGLAAASHGGSLPALVKAAGCSTWSMDHRNLDATAVAEAHALGLAVLPWTVNDEAEMARLIELGADGIVTDYPDRLRAVMTRRGMKLPP